MTHRVFEETQRFRQVWLWTLLICVSILLIVYVPIQLTQASGEDPMPISSILVVLFCLVFAIGINALFIFSRLHTRIDSDGVTIIFKPFFFKPLFYKWEDIDKAYVRRYRPIWEFGGWGVRYGWNGRAYNTAGNMGLQLLLKSGKKVLVGTQKPSEIDKFLKKYIYSKESEIQD